MICITMGKLNWSNHGHTFPHIIYTLYSHLSRVIKHSEFLMIDLNLYNIIDLAYICFCRVTIRAIFPGRVLARISTLPKISRFGFVCVRCMTLVPYVFEMLSRYFESKQYRNLGQDMSGKNGMYGHPNFCLVMTDKVLWCYWTSPYNLKCHDAL